MYQCDFCNIPLTGKYVLPDNMQDILVEGLCQTIIYNGEFFYVKPDISPVVENHLLIIPKEHIFCINDVPPCFFEELQDIKKRIIQYYDSIDMNYLFFEHGCCSEKEPGSSCIHHAHLHSIPLSIDNEKAIIQELVKVIGLPNTIPQEIKGKTYLYCESSTIGKQLFWTDDIQRSQLFRIIIANVTGHMQRARWQNCLINEAERKRSKKWLQKFKNFSLA